MKKIATAVLAVILSLGCATPAFAAAPHHGAGHCLNYEAFCQGMTQRVLAPTVQLMNEQLGAALAQARGNGAQAAAGYAVGNRQMTAPGLCANGACGINFIDADGDGVCDNYAGNRQSANGATGSGAHRGGGQHGCMRR